MRVPVVLAPGQRLQVTLEARDPGGAWLGDRTVTLAHPSAGWFNRLRAGDRALLASLLMGAALLAYLAVRLIGLSGFPIYFFTDEAVQTILATDLLRDGLRGYSGELLPTYFPNGSQYNLSLSVYLQALPTLMFDRSVFVTRLTPVLISLLAAWAVGAMLRDVFRVRFAWVGVLLLSVTPAWFLHSRTAFETSLAVSFYAAFLYGYLRYRQDNPRYLYAAVLFGGLCFYSYSPAQVVMAVTALLLLLSDLGYHRKQGRVIGRAVLLALGLALPYLRFQLLHPGESMQHLQTLQSYWVQNLPLTEKLARYGELYLKGLSPAYWYLANQDLARHIVKGYGHLLRPALPLLVVGLGLALRQVKSSPHRTLLIALLAAPTGAALVGLGITRLLFLVVPAAVLTALGLAALLDRLDRWLAARLPAPERAHFGLTLLVFALLLGGNLYLLRDALVNGPLWYRDYGLGGMQWGAHQLFPELARYRQAHPEAKLLVSPSWANGTDVVARFFDGDPLPYRLGSIEGYLARYEPIDPDQVFVMIPEELEQVRSSGKFADIQVEQAIDAPDGGLAFAFVRLRYVDNIQTVFLTEQAQRTELVDAQAVLPDGTPIRVRHSHIDMGQIQDIVDGNPQSVIRTREANPLRLVFDLPTARPLTGVRVRVGGMPTRVTLRLTVADGAVSTLSQEVDETPNPRFVSFSLEEELAVTQVEVEILSIRDGEPAHVHAWEVELQP
jgi:4-amino-4-deoxy-L-arabinose transferase-like glycosyltransferase